MRQTVLLLASMALVVLVASSVCSFFLIPTLQTVQAAPTGKSNILFVMTDDMPHQLVERMPHVRERITARGLELTNAYVSESLCCPSRATFLTGQYPHNTGIYKNGPPNGGWQDFKGFGLEANTVARWVSSAGYRTAFVGKYMNGYDARTVPPHWSYWFARASASMPGKKANDNGNIVNYANNRRSWIDIERKKALEFVDRNTDRASDPRFMLFMWPCAPHLPAGGYPDRYADLYKNEAPNMKPSFNEADVSDKPQWVRSLPPITNGQRNRLIRLKRDQLRSLRGVDDAVNAVMDKLQSRGELDNTYIVFTSDNGTHMGEHRWRDWQGAKNTAYEEAAKVPFVVRGPGIPAGVSRNHLVLNNDLAPTFARIAGATPPGFVDGRNLLPVWAARPPATWRTAVLNERPAKTRHPVPVYYAVMTQRYTYVEYATGEKELYDRQDDPYQLRSIHRTADLSLLSDLHGRLRSLKGCAAESCRRAEDGS